MALNPEDDGGWYWFGAEGREAETTAASGGRDLECWESARPDEVVGLEAADPGARDGTSVTTWCCVPV